MLDTEKERKFLHTTPWQFADGTKWYKAIQSNRLMSYHCFAFGLAIVT